MNENKSIEVKLIKEEVDLNMIVETKLDLPDVKWYDVRRAPFEIYGLYDAQNEYPFKRMPDDVAIATSKGVTKLYLDTAGGRVRFCTDSSYVAIKAEMPFIDHRTNMSVLGTSGLDIYEDFLEDGYRSRFCAAFRPAVGITDGYESVVKFTKKKLRYFTIHMPSYNHLDNLYIGLEDGAYVGEGKKYKDVAPIIYYGSSITQGACASRPGLSYENMIARHIEIDYKNFGFAGNGRAELPIIEYLAGLEMSMFVSDYDHNASNAAYLRDTHCRLYQTIRAKHPDIPYIMISRPDFAKYNGTGDSIRRRDVIIDTFRYAREIGDENVYYIDGEGFFRSEDEGNCTTDGTHPNDYGFMKMADSIKQTMLHALRKM